MEPRSDPCGAGHRLKSVSVAPPWVQHVAPTHERKTPTCEGARRASSFLPRLFSYPLPASKKREGSSAKPKASASESKSVAAPHHETGGRRALAQRASARGHQTHHVSDARWSGSLSLPWKTRQEATDVYVLWMRRAPCGAEHREDAPTKHPRSPPGG